MRGFPRPVGAAFAKGTWAGLALLMGASLSAGAVPAAAADISTRLSIVSPETHPFYAGAMRFKAVLEAESKGKIQVQVFANAQAGDEAASLQLVRSGGLQFAQHSSSLASSAFGEPILQGWSLPFLYRDADAAYRAWDSDLAAKSYGVFEKQGFKCLVLWDAGFRQLATSRPVDTPDDVRGMKLRTPDGAIYVSTWKALGAVPTPMALTELYTSLQTGVVQGTELPLQGIEALKIHEILKNFAAINYMNDPICFSVSLQFYKSLTTELQKAVMKAAKESTVAERSAARDSYDKALQKVIAAGVKASRPDTAAFRKMVAPVYDEYYKKTGANGRALVEGILALTK